MAADFARISQLHAELSKAYQELADRDDRRGPADDRVVRGDAPGPEPDARASDKARHAEGEKERRQRVLVRPVPVNPDAVDRAPVPVRVEVVDQSRRGAADDQAARALAVRALEAALADAEKLTFGVEWAARLRAIRDGVDKLIAPGGD